MREPSWMLWILFTASFCVFVALEIGMRYVRFKREPRAWSARAATIGVTLWVIAVMAVANLVRLGWTPWTALTAIIVGVSYAVALTLIGRVVRQREAPHLDEARRL